VIHKAFQKTLFLNKNKIDFLRAGERLALENFGNPSKTLWRNLTRIHSGSCMEGG